MGMVPDTDTDDQFKAMKSDYVTLACAAMLASYTRMTYSLVIIIIETSQSLSLFVPVLFTILVANAVGSLFT